jgi:dipeptidyl aminopeptidase/acylaminoacyl peptidase
VAYLDSWQRRLNVTVQKIGGSGSRRVTHAEKRDIDGYFWANNHRLVYIQDKGGNENYHLYAVNRDGSNSRDLTPFKDVRVSVIDPLQDIPTDMLIGMNRRDPRIFDVYRINIETGALAMIAENPGNISQWVTDNAGRLRVAVSSDGLNNTLYYRQTEKDPFRPIVRTGFRDALEPLAFTFDDRDLYVRSNLGRDKKALYRFDLETGRRGELIFEHPEVDIAGLLRSKKRKVLTGVAFITDRPRFYFFDDRRRELQRFLEKRLADKTVRVIDMSRDERRVVVRTYSDKSRGAYYFCDRDSRELFKLSDVSPWLTESELSAMRPIEYTSRDGWTIHGYLTLPPGQPVRNLPVIVLPHGGPWARDVWGFDAEVQFLANRGLAVLQMNFRGSTGYGKAFWMAGFKQWGLDMQDDITDGIRWLMAEGIADPTRIGIYGASYGGYAVLAGLAFTPDLYACGVDYVGVSNLFTLLKTIPPYWELGRQRMYAMIGHPERDRELLRRVSPVFHADQITAPLFVAQGANDPRVKKSESDQIVRALQEHGIPVRYMVKQHEGHGFQKEENRFDFYRTMEGFLGKHLGSRVE